MHLYVFDDFRLGVRSGDRLVDVTALVDARVPPADRMTALISSWHELGSRVVEASGDGGGTPLAEVTVRAPQPRPSKVVAAPVNYRLHQQEMGGAQGVYAGATIKTIETYAGFVKAPSSVVGPDGAVEIPFPDRRVDHEAEVGVVIGRRASRVRREEALAYVFGYVPLLDITIRGDEDRSFRKSFDTFTPLGPAIVTADEIGDPNDLEFELRVNGEVRQGSSTGEMIYDVARLIELYSQAMTLMPGDVIATGTPEGVGPLEPGDEVVLDVRGVGRLVMPVRAREAAAA